MLHARTVLDASSVLAFVQDEQGVERVEEAIGAGALISTVNWAEVLAKLVLVGGDSTQITAMARPAVEGIPLAIVGFDDDQARESARLVRYTRSLGLSLADRAALALASLRRLPVLTADRAWRSLRLPIKIEVIR